MQTESKYDILIAPFRAEDVASACPGAGAAAELDGDVPR